MIHEREHDASEGPNVYFLVNLIAFEEVNLFRCPVNRGRHLFYLLGDRLSIPLRQAVIILSLGAAAEVADLPLSVVALKHVFNLEISVCDSPIVQVAQPVRDIVNYLQQFGLVRDAGQPHLAFGLNNIKKSAMWTVLQEDVDLERVAGLPWVDLVIHKFDNVVMLANQLQNVHFRLECPLEHFINLKVGRVLNNQIVIGFCPDLLHAQHSRRSVRLEEHPFECEDFQRHVVPRNCMVACAADQVHQTCYSTSCGDCRLRP